MLSEQQSSRLLLKDKRLGHVVLTGQSNLRFSGEHLIVRDLVFKQGYTPTGEVIAFRTSADDVANTPD